MQRLRILFYTDGRIDDDPGPVAWSIANLKQFIVHRMKGLIDVEIDFINRHLVRGTQQTLQGANKLTLPLVSAYDEIWIFGHKQVNIPASDPAVGKIPENLDLAEPYNELDWYERAILGSWMQVGGLMLTGDHSEPNPNSDPQSSSDHSTFITLGAALGRHLPRAGQLRDWDGPPTDRTEEPRDNYNTLVLVDPAKDEYDETPQSLVDPSTAHKLFSFVDPNGHLAPITILPDHEHEGSVPELKKLDANWPAGSPLPQVVARGTDKREFNPPRVYNLVAAFDGDAVNVGRIVSDSSFHHYLNVNLRKLEKRDSQGNPEPGSLLDQIAHYYCNLALWLAPKRVRDQLKVDLFSRLATHPLVLDARGASRDKLGAAARLVAESEFGLSNMYQLFGAPASEDGPQNVDDLLSAALLANAAPTFLDEIAAEPLQISLEAILSSVVREFHNFFVANGIHSPDRLKTVPGAATIIDQGLQRTFQQ